jgi:UDP-N-acetylglucosamine 2-epimerase (non-hydrolysing)
MKLLHVVGARPNFMKIAPLMRALARHPDAFQQVLVHTGQHYDSNMSQVFFDELDLPRPDVNLEVGSGSHARQTAQVMEKFEPVLLSCRPDWVVVPGDVNSTLACALVASKLGVRVAHVEAGLRSFDRSMPEEINRILTDQLSDLLFTPSRDADENLAREGINPKQIFLVGNIMIDSLIHLLPKTEERWAALSNRFGIEKFILVTLHRPANVDEPAALRELFSALPALARDLTVIFPVHPRTRARIESLKMSSDQPGLHLIDPLGYLDFLALQRNASLVITDSGGVQEETTYLGVPCLTIRPNTERPVTLTNGTNRLVEPRAEAIVTAAREWLDRGSKHDFPRPELWDGHTAERIVKVLQLLGLNGVGRD